MSAPRRRRFTWMAILIATFGTFIGLTLPAAAQPAGAANGGNGVSAGPPGSTGNGAGQLVPMPTLPKNICNNSALPTDYGTNFPTPSDPNGFGFANQTAIGWEGNYYAPFEYLSGSYFARGVPLTYQPGGKGTTYCGAMYSFGVYNYGLAAGQAPPAQSEQWTEADGYLPAMTTSFTRNDVAITITDFANEQSIGGTPTELVYTRVTVTNKGTTAVDVPSGQSGPNLVTLNDESDTVQPGHTVQHDFVAAVDDFSTTTPLPSVTALTPAKGNAGALPYDAAYQHMANYWNQRLSATPDLSLPNVSLANTNDLKDPGTSIDNAYKAAFIYTRIVQVGEAPFSGANNYAYLLNHDVPGILANRFEEGDFTDAQSLLLNGRISEASNFNEHGANWYWDGPWRTPVAWAAYLEGTNDTAFVSQYFHDDANGPSQWGPSLLHPHAHRLPGTAQRHDRLPEAVQRQRLPGHLAVRRRDGACRARRVQVHRHQDRQHRRGTVGRRRLHQPAERGERGPGRERAGQRLQLLAVRGQRSGHRRPLQLAERRELGRL